MSKYYSNKSDFSEAGSNLQSISGGDTSNSNNSYNYNNYISGGYPSSGSTSDSYNYNSYNNYMSGGYPSGVSSKSMSQLINDIEEVANTVTSEGVADLYVQTGEAALNVTKDSNEFDKATTRVSKILKSARKIHQNIMQNVDSKFTLGIDKVLEGLNKINGSNSKYKTKNLTRTEHNYRPVNGNICAPTAYYDDKKEVPYSLSEILDGKASPIKAAKDVYSKRLEAVKELLKHKDKMTDQQIKEIRGKSAEKILELWYPKEIPDYQKLKASRFQEEHRETLHMVDFALKTFASFAALGGIIFSLPTGGSSLGVTFAATAYIATDKAYSAFSGRTMITGDRLSTEERVWAGIDAVSSILSERAGFYLMKLQKAGKTGSTLLKLTSHADDANDISKVAYAYATDKDPKDAVGNLVVGQVKGFVAKKAGSLLHSKFGKTNATDVPDIPTNSTKQHIEVDSSGLNSKKLKIDPTAVHQKKNPKLDLKIEPTVKADLASTPKPHVDVETSKIKPVEAVAGAATVVPKSKTPDIDVLTKPKDLSTINSEAVDHVGTAKPKVDLDVPEVKQIRADYNDYVAQKTSLGEKPLSMSDWKQKNNVSEPNFANYKEFSTTKIDEFKTTLNDVETKITVETRNAAGEVQRIQLKAVGIDETGKIRIQDYTTAKDGLSIKRQDILDNLSKYGGTIVGEGKGRFTGGTKIEPGTRIEIISQKTSNISIEHVSPEIKKATFAKFDELASRETSWNTAEKQASFKETFDTYAERAVKEGAVPNKETFYKMYEARQYDYPKAYKEAIKQPYLEGGASSVVSGDNVKNFAFNNGKTVGRMDGGVGKGNFTTSIVEDSALLYDKSGNLKSGSEIATVKGVRNDTYDSGMFQYEYSPELVKNMDKEGLIQFPNGDTPGSSSLNIPGAKTWAGSDIKMSESELLMPTIDMQEHSYDDFLYAIKKQGYYEIKNPTVVVPGENTTIDIEGIFRINQWSK